MKKLTYLTFSLFSVFSFAQEVSKERINTVLATLASDEMKGREIGTQEMKMQQTILPNFLKKTILNTVPEILT